MLRITYRYQYGKKFIQIEQLCKKLLYSFDSCCKTKKCMFEIPDFLTGTGGSMLLISLLGQEAACMVAQPAMVLEMQGAHFL